MAKSNGAHTPVGQERSLFLLLRETGDALEAASPPFNVAAGEARLREAAQAHGLLRSDRIPENDLAVTDANLEEEAPPFDVEAGAARLREAAHARGLLSRSVSVASAEIPAARRYRRIVVKLSGEALAGSRSSGVDPASLSRIAEEILSVHDLGVQVAVVVGGGNYFRGRMAEGWGISRAEADNIGMLGTIMNALMLRGALTARTDTDVRVMTAVPMHSVAEPFIRLRAVQHLDRGLIVLLAGAWPAVRDH